MFQIHGACARTVLWVGKEDTQVGFGDGTVGFHDHRVFFPFFRVDDQVLADKLLCVIHRVLVDELDHQRHRLAVRHACPYGKTVFGIFLQADAEETFVLYARPHVAMSGTSQTHVMRVLVEGAVILQRDVAEHFPTHVMVGSKFKRTVLDEFGIQAAVGSEVDVFKEHAVHRGLYFSPDFLGLYGHGVVLCVNRVRSCHECYTCKQRVDFHDTMER